MTNQSVENSISHVTEEIERPERDFHDDEHEEDINPDTVQLGAPKMRTLSLKFSLTQI
jgi:hypothetical protein